MFADFVRIDGQTTYTTNIFYVNRALITSIRVYKEDRHLRLTNAVSDPLTFNTGEELDIALNKILNGETS